MVALEAKARERTGNQAAVPAPKAQRNFTDPQSRIMLSRPDGWVQGYNVGIAVTSPAAMPARPPDALGRRAAEALARAGLVAS